MKPQMVVVVKYSSLPYEVTLYCQLWLGHCHLPYSNAKSTAASTVFLDRLVVFWRICAGVQ